MLRQSLLLFAAVLVAGQVVRGEGPAPNAIISGWREFTASDGFEGVSVHDVLVDGDDVWVGSDNGLSLYRNGSWMHWGHLSRFKTQSVHRLSIDPQTHDLWIGTWGAGLVRFSAGRFNSFDQINAGLAGNLVFDVAALDGRIWAATNAGLCTFDPVDNTWQTFFTRRKDQTEKPIVKLTVVNGRLWAETYCGELLEFDPRTNHWLTVVCSGLSGNDPKFAIEGAVVTPEDIWSVGANKLVRMDRNGTITARYPLPPSPIERFVTCVAVRNRKDVWIGTRHGLLIHPDTTEPLWIVHKNRDRDVGGLVEAYRGAQLLSSQVTTEGLPDNRIHCMAFDDKGVWVGTVHGLAYGAIAPNTIPETNSSPPSVKSVVGHDQSSNTGVVPANKSKSIPEVGYLGPTARTIAVPPVTMPDKARADLLAVQVAVDLANRLAGRSLDPAYQMAMQLPGYATYGWGTPEDDYPRYALQPNVAGLVGYLNPHRRIEAAVAARTEVPVISAAPSARDDGTSSLPPNPWVFRCFGEQPRQHRLLINYLLDQRQCKRLAILHTSESTAQRSAMWCSGHAHGRGYAPVLDLNLGNAVSASDDMADTVIQARPDAVLVWSDAHIMAKVVRRLVQRGLDVIYVGRQEIATPEFLNEAGPVAQKLVALDGLAAGLPDGATDRTVTDFIVEYSQRNTRGQRVIPPDENALRTYEATNHLLQALGVAGMDRERVRQVLELMQDSPTGERHYELHHHSPGLKIAEVKNGIWKWRFIDVGE